MTLLIAVFSAVICTIIWYKKAPKNELLLGRLCLMYWGASIMWFVDEIFSFVEMKSTFFEPSAGQMLNDAFLGLSAVALGLVIWVVTLLIQDPRGVLKATLFKSK